jgi:hypothetical protein
VTLAELISSIEFIGSSVVFVVLSGPSGFFTGTVLTTTAVLILFEDFPSSPFLSFPFPW